MLRHSLRLKLFGSAQVASDVGLCAARAATRVIDTPTTDATFAVVGAVYFATHDKQCFVI